MRMFYMCKRYACDYVQLNKLFENYASDILKLYLRVANEEN